MIYEEFTGSVNATLGGVAAVTVSSQLKTQKSNGIDKHIINGWMELKLKDLS